MTSDDGPLRFAIRVDRRFLPWLVLFGVLGRRNAYARLTDDELIACFGFFSLRTALANVERWEISGPYHWWRAIGVRGTSARSEITFGGSAHGGVALIFRERLRWLRFYRLERIYLTLDDLEGFAAELARRGIPGDDVSRGTAERTAERAAQNG